MKIGKLWRVLADGAMVVVPIGALVLLVVAILRKMQHLSERFAGQIGHPLLIAVIVFVLICLIFGLLVRSAIGGAARRIAERRVFEQIPGYRLAKALTGDGPLAADGGSALRPALAAIEEGQCPALVMDQFADGRLVVFVPSTPTPMSGALYIFTPDKITYLDVPLLPFMKLISSWGLGLREIVEAQEALEADPARLIP